MSERLSTIKKSPKLKQSLQNIKPQRSIWGFLGVLIFFILPEVVAFAYGDQVTAFAKEAQLTSVGIELQYYELLVMLFESGGSWINLIIGLALLIWLFF
jgi:uncharacterized membrane protein